MNRNSNLCGVLALVTAIGSSGYALTAQANSQQSPQSCYIQNQAGQQVDLSSICGKPSMESPLDKIDANTPVPIEMVGSDKPSARWNMIPNLQNAPDQGKTYKQAPPTQVQILGGQDAK